MKNINVINEFVNFGIDEKIKAENLYFEQDVLYSYGSHFPLCIRLKDFWLINKNSYSNTTSTHKGHLIREVSNAENFKDAEKQIKNGEITDIKFLSTAELKEIVLEHLKDNKGLRFISFADLEKLRIIQSLKE